MFLQLLVWSQAENKEHKRANHQAWAFLLRFTQRRDIYKRDSSALSWTLRRRLATTFSSLLSLRRHSAPRWTVVHADMPQLQSRNGMSWPLIHLPNMKASENIVTGRLWGTLWEMCFGILVHSGSRARDWTLGSCLCQESASAAELYPHHCWLHG